jgi:cell division septation protein DedD
MSNEDGDVTIGPGKLLGLFFMLVVICGVFFAIGYSLGKTSAHEQAMNDRSPLSASLSAPVIGDSNAAKPSAGVAAKSEAEPSSADEPTQGKTEPDLTFFNAVKADKKAAGADSPAPSKAAQEKSAEQKTVAASIPAASAPEVTSAAQPSTKVSAPQSPDVKPSASGSFVVQIAAVTREEDAAALAGALRKKNYSVFVVNNPAVHDKFYHVQVGPFATLQDADAMKAKLTGEGYNPIVKRT